MYRIEKWVSREDAVRALLPENAYVRRLRAAGQDLQIGNVLVDRPQIVDRRFLCDTLHCMKFDQKQGRYRGSCCTDLEVDLTPRELSALHKNCGRYLALEGAAPGRPEYEIASRVVDTTEWWEENYREETCLSHSREKVCSMGYIASDGRLLCGLNAMAREMMETVAPWKGPTCFLFPLHYVEYEPGQYLLTILCEDNYEYMDGAKEIGRLACLRDPQVEAPPAYVSLQAEIVWLFGKAFYGKLRRAAEVGLADVN